MEQAGLKGGSICGDPQGPRPGYRSPLNAKHTVSKEKKDFSR
jgi:hypothetical protein